jgi:hypothetical protein
MLDKTIWGRETKRIATVAMDHLIALSMHALIVW